MPQRVKSAKPSTLFVSLPILSMLGIMSLLGFDGIYVGLLTPFSGMLLILVALIVYVLGIAATALKKNYLLSLSFSSALAVAIVMMVTGLVPALFFEATRVHIFEMQNHEDCVRNATPWQGTNKVSVCEKQILRNGNIQSFIYDSADEAAMPPAQRTAAWIKKIEGLYPEAGSTNLEVISEVGDHFYYVTFDVTSNR